jgi:hypothetical protein
MIAYMLYFCGDPRYIAALIDSERHIQSYILDDYLIVVYIFNLCLSLCFVD